MIGVIFACLGQEKGYWKSNDIIYVFPAYL